MSVRGSEALGLSRCKPWVGPTPKRGTRQGVQGLRFRVWGLGFRVQGSGFRASSG